MSSVPTWRLGRRTWRPRQQVNYHNVAMGQGQDVVAMAKMELGHKEGHWVMLQNIHLMPRWCVSLEKCMDNYAIEGRPPSCAARDVLPRAT